MSNIYPWGTSLISFYVLIISYAIVKHHLMDIRLALTKAGIFLSVYVLTLGFPFWVAYKSNSKFLPVSLAVALALIGPAIHRRLQAKAEAVLFAQQKKYQNFLLRAGRGMLREHDLDHLLRSIVRVIRYGVKVQFAAALLFNAEHKRYELKALRDHQHMPDKFSVPQEHKLIGLLQQRRIPLSHEDIVGILEQYSGSPIHLVVPAFSDEILLGFLVLGEKEDHTLYTEDDIRVFSILAGQATMAIENCIFIKEAQDYQKRIAQGEKLASLGGMAYNLSHQMGNHLHAFEQYLVEFDLNMEEVMEKYPNPTPEREKTVVEFISETNKKLRERFKHCATLTSGICDHARKMGNPVFKAFPFEKCVEFSLWSLDLKHSLAAEARPFEMIVEISGEGTIYGIEGLLDEAVYNIIDNCYEAIKEKRDLCLSLEDKALYKPFIKAVFAETEDNYLITISDNGVGVKLENRTKMFDPFFTTKSSEVSGRGIGMYAVHKIIVEHLKGKIRFESEHMIGITFFIELPKKAQDTTTDA
jgi:signal transduction histidine kinase